ncbi:hypothetical protein [Streptomyces sp. NPDC048332]|uniref:DUF7848 domain-containing protein n=1 Tax=Streptomyces sp. NPDC048332 TaxID=3154619 RepID=UPI00341D95DF
MSVRSVIRPAEWMIGVDTTPVAAGPVYEIECTACGQCSDPAEERTPPEDWARRHASRNTSHREYRAVIASLVRLTPAVGSPLHAEAL